MITERQKIAIVQAVNDEIARQKISDKKREALVAYLNSTMATELEQERQERREGLETLHKWVMGGTAPTESAWLNVIAAQIIYILSASTYSVELDDDAMQVLKDLAVELTNLATSVGEIKNRLPPPRGKTNSTPFPDLEQAHPKPR